MQQKKKKNKKNKKKKKKQKKQKKKNKLYLVSVVVNQLTGKFIMHDKLAC